jgi:acyl carrier protein
MDTLQVIQKIIHKINNIDPSLIKPDTEFRDDLGMESIDVTEVVLDIEKDLGVIIEDNELANLTTIEDFVKIIDEKRAGLKPQLKN